MKTEYMTKQLPKKHFIRIHRSYLVNAHRVFLIRARQGMVIVVPEGDSEDHTRKPEYYDTTYQYLKRAGLDIL
jgi:LytTr DNA-binding domain.